MEKNTRTSQRIINAEILKAAGVEENRLIVSGGGLLKKSPSGDLLHFGNISTERYHRHNQRFYIKTEGGHYIFDTGAHDGFQKKAKEEEPEPEPKAIKLYYYKEKLYHQTKDGVLTGGDQSQARNSKINSKKREGGTNTTSTNIPIMHTLTKTRAMSHAATLAALNATAMNAATKEAEKKKQDAIEKKKEEEEQAFKMKEAS
jgi:hypothetical protein